MAPRDRTDTATADHDVSQRQAGRYLHGAIDLRNAIHFNQIDAEFANQEHGEIRYVFDANVVRFFLNPFRAEEYGKVAPFERLSRDTLQALAAITAEFLMSRALAGQWGGTPLISSGHAEEVASHAERLRNVGLEQLKLLDQDDIGPEIQQMIERARRETGLRDTIHGKFRPLEGLGDHLDDPALEARELSRVVRQNLLRPLHLDDFATADMLKVDPDERQEVIDLIQGFRNASPRGQEQSHRGSANDADAFLQVVRLNEALEQRKNLARPMRFAFVTTDQSVYNAAVAWWWDRRGSAAGGNAFPVRRLTQYIPFLNVDEMPNQANTTTVFRDVRSAVEGFMVADGRRLGSPPLQLPGWASGPTDEAGSPFFEAMRDLATTMSARTAADPAYRDTLEELNALWSDLTRETVFLNANLLGRKIEAFRKLSAFLAEAEDVREAVVALIRDTIADVERAHAKLSVQDSLAEMISSMEAAGPGTHMRRALAVPASRFRDVIDEPLFDFLTGFVRNAERSTLDHLLNQLGRCAAHRAFIFVAAVAFWASRWDIAHHFIERAKELMPAEEDPQHPQERPDLMYLDCLVERYVAMDADVTATERIDRLKGCVMGVEELVEDAYLSDSPFVRCRSVLEATLLHVQIAFAMHNAEGAASHIPEADRFFDKAHRLTHSILEHMRDIPGDLEQDTRKFLHIEVVVALTYCLVYRALYHGQQADMSDVSLESYPQQIKQLLDEVGDTVPRI
ncbi:MAG: hypothetical protein AB3N17_03600, partial [Tateyamaria sp.]